MGERKIEGRYMVPGCREGGGKAGLWRLFGGGERRFRRPPRCARRIGLTDRIMASMRAILGRVW